jgi:hypothetical protein
MVVVQVIRGFTTSVSLLAADVENATHSIVTMYYKGVGLRKFTTERKHCSLASACCLLQAHPRLHASHLVIPACGCISYDACSRAVLWCLWYIAMSTAPSAVSTILTVPWQTGACNAPLCSTALRGCPSIVMVSWNALFFLRAKCAPYAMIKYCHNVLYGGHISQSLALFGPEQKR